jgi:hypothetical protein
MGGRNRTNWGFEATREANGDGLGIGRRNGPAGPLPLDDLDDTALCEGIR